MQRRVALKTLFITKTRHLRILISAYICKMLSWCEAGIGLGLMDLVGYCSMLINEYLDIEE